MAERPAGAFPDVPRVPSLPHLRPQHSSPQQILAECSSVLRAARDSVSQVEHCSRPGHQLGYIRVAVVDIRRVTFVLQTLSSRTAGFDEWYAPIQDRLRADPLMRYFVELRNEIEKRGLPGALAELFDVDSGVSFADVACFEDEHGLAVSGAVRPEADVPSGEFEGAPGLRNFRLPDPPTTHQGVPLTDLRFASLATLALDFLETHVVQPASARFEAPPV